MGAIIKQKVKSLLETKPRKFLLVNSRLLKLQKELVRISFKKRQKKNGKRLLGREGGPGMYLRS
jgi:hypothetical protein